MRAKRPEISKRLNDGRFFGPDVHVEARRRLPPGPIESIVPLIESD